MKPIEETINNSVCPTVTQARDIALGGLFGALAIALPILFHALGLGKLFLPMYLPILALGLLVSWPVAALVGLIAPLLSAIFTGMPPLAPPIAFIMMGELAALATGASLARSKGLGIYPATIIGILASRIAGVLMLITLGRALGFQQGVYEFAILGLLASWPGIALQITCVPGAIYIIERTSLLGYNRRSSSCRQKSTN